MMIAVALMCATASKVQAYTINVAEQQNCTVTVSPQKESYDGGESITVTLTSTNDAVYDYFEVYYECTEAEWWAAQSAHAPRRPMAPRRGSSFGERRRLEIWHLDGHRDEPCELAEGATYTFTMPERNVELEAFFIGGSAVENTITVEQTANGTTSVDRSKAAPGTIVNITATPANDCSVDKVYVYEKETTGGAIYETLLDWTQTDPTHFSFTMPANPVRVKVTYQQGSILILKDDEDNTTAIETAIDDSTTTYNVVLEGRTLWKDGSWNTLCLPFDVTAKQIAGSDHPLHGAVIKELDVDGTYDTDGNEDADGTCHTGFENSTLYLYFKDATEMEAGVPYIVRWDKPDDYVAYNGSNANWCSDIVNPEFKLSKLRGSEPGYIESNDGKVRFIGNYNPTTLSGEYMTMLYLDGGSTLSHPDPDMSINAFRAHLQLDPSLGDVNSDGNLSVTDLMLLVNYILNENIDNFNVEKADINGDGNISVSDVMMLVNMILHTGTNLSVVVNGADGITFGGSATGTGSARAGESTLWDDDIF